MSLKEELKESRAMDPAVLIFGAYGALMIITAVVACGIEGQDSNVIRDIALCGGIFLLLSLHFLNERWIEKLEKRIEELEAKDAGEQRRVQLPAHAGSGSDDEPPTEPA